MPLRMTLETQLVLGVLLSDLHAEWYGYQIGQSTRLPGGTRPSDLGPRLERAGWLESRWEDIDPSAEGRPAKVLPAHGVRRGPGPPGAGLGSLANDRLCRDTGRGFVTRRKQQSSAVRSAVNAMEGAAQGIPSELRNRHHDKLVAEVHGLGRLAAWRHAVGVAASARSMHAALTDGGPQPVPAPRRMIGCRTNTHHLWMLNLTSDGQRYRACARCGTEFVSTGSSPI